jgi:hypothetical protein
MRWFVCDMDEGVLKIEDSRRAALEWSKQHCGAESVVARRSYGPGDYEYWIGTGPEDHSQVYIIREDRITSGEWKIEGPVSEAVPVYKDGEYF